MNLHVGTVSLGATRIENAKRFYVSLGCGLRDTHDGFAADFGDGTYPIHLCDWNGLAKQADHDPASSGFRGLHISLIFAAAAPVDALLDRVSASEGRVIKPAKKQLWGGYSGTFADPEGHLWKVASSVRPARKTSRSGTEQVSGATPKEIAVTLGAANFKRAKQFYKAGLHCQVAKSFGTFATFEHASGSATLGLYKWDALAKDAGVAPNGSGFRGFAVWASLPSRDLVDLLINDARQAGGRVITPPTETPEQGYSGYFADTEGYLWRAITA